VVRQRLPAARIVNLYDLADAAYDAKEIREISARLGHVAIIDDNPGRGQNRDSSPSGGPKNHTRTTSAIFPLALPGLWGDFVLMNRSFSKETTCLNDHPSVGMRNGH